MRSVLRLIFFVAVLLLISPFFISSLLIDQRGVELSGRVFSKDEYIVVHSASWDRKCDVMVEYTAPDGSGVSFLTGQMQPDQFDHVQTGDPVPLHYLREKDLPDYPGTKTLRQMHLLPSVRLANRNTWSGLATLVSTHETALTAVLSVVLILFLWRVFRVPYFAWVLFACALLAIGISYVSEFPNPMPAPEHNVRTAKGTVKSLENWKWLFSGTRRKGVRADQPIEIASVQFVPEGRTQPVVAVDLIDAGSVPGLREHATVTVDYDAGAPRIALIRGATRHFPGRNLRGIVFQGFAVLILLIAVWAAGLLFSRVYRRLLERRSP